jgi:hypothetical protein
MAIIGLALVVLYLRHQRPVAGDPTPAAQQSVTPDPIIVPVPLATATATATATEPPPAPDPIPAPVPTETVAVPSQPEPGSGTVMLPSKPATSGRIPNERAPTGHGPGTRPTAPAGSSKKKPGGGADYM